MDTITPDLPPVRWRHKSPAAPKRRRVFLWVFLAVQALFAVWLITGAASTGNDHAQAVAYCHAHQFISFAQCVSDYGSGAKISSAIGVGLIFTLWAVVDIILGVSYGVWKLARR